MNPNFCPTCHTAIPDHAPGGFCPACLLRDADDSPTQVRLAPSVAEISEAFPQWEILALIGEGGMGFVYQIRQPALDRIVALKILSPELLRDPAFAERFAREARVLGKLNHPNIVTVYESGESGGFFYLVMEYVDGVNLRQAMRAGRFTPQQALAVVPGICDALQAAHAQGVWHRDIKPENILLDAQGNVKIVDFGIARLVGDPRRDFTLTRTGAALGSAAYMAPEQHEKPHDVDHRADIYSLGVVIYEMLTGELPLGRFPAPSAKAAVDARIDEIVFRTLEKEREMRQQSATEVKTDMQNAAVAPKLPAPSVIDFSSWKLVLAAVVFSYIGTAWNTYYGPDGVRGVTSVGLFSPWLMSSSIGGGQAYLSLSNSFSLLAMFLAGACWLRWFWRKRTRKQDLASFLLVNGPGFAVKVGCMWVSAVAFFLWAWMTVTGLYLSLGSLLTGRQFLYAPVWEFLFAGVASGTVWTLFKTLHASSSFISSKPSATTPERDQETLSPGLEMKRKTSGRYGNYVKWILFGGILLLIPTIILTKASLTRRKMPLGYQKVEFNDFIEFAFVHPKAITGGCSISIPLRISEKWVPPSGQVIALQNESNLWIRCRVNKTDKEKVVVEVSSSLNQKTWESHEIILNIGGSPNQSIRFVNGTEVSVQLQFVGNEYPELDARLGKQSTLRSAKSVFGPVVERSLYFSDNMRAYLDFQSGESSRAQWALSAIPTDEAQKTWLKQTGVDAYAIEPISNKPDQSGVVVHEHSRLSSWSGGCVFALVPHSQSFDNPREEDMEACLKDAADTQALMGGTYWFKSSDGAKGIVHLYGINDSPPQVQLRYRLFQQQP